MDIKASGYSNVYSMNEITNNASSNKQILANDKTSTPNVSSQVNISSLGKIHQNIDDLFSKVDDIYMSHLSKAQQTEIQDKYKALDDIFNSSDPSEVALHNADKIFNRIDELFSHAESSLTDADYKKLDGIDKKLATLFDKETSIEEGVFEKIDTLSEQQDAVIVSSLNGKQKEALSSLNKSLSDLFEKQDLTKEQTQKVNQLFDSIDNILNKAFDNLSEKEKEKIVSMDEAINKLYEKLES